MQPALKREETETSTERPPPTSGLSQLPRHQSATSSGSSAEAAAEGTASRDLDSTEMPLPRCCEQAAAATGGRLRLLRSVRRTEGENSLAPVETTMGKGVCGSQGGGSAAVSPPHSRGISNRQSRGGAVDMPVQQQQQEQGLSKTYGAAALVRRRIGGVHTNGQGSNNAAATDAAAATAAAAATNATAAATTASAAAGGAAALSRCRSNASTEASGTRESSPKPLLSSSSFLFPSTNDPVEHVAKTYPGGPAAFAAAVEAAATPASKGRCWAGFLLVLLLMMFAAAATVLLIVLHEPSLLLRQNQPQHEVQQQQHMVQQKRQQEQQQHLKQQKEKEQPKQQDHQEQQEQLKRQEEQEQQQQKRRKPSSAQVSETTEKKRAEAETADAPAASLDTAAAAAAAPTKRSKTSSAAAAAAAATAESKGKGEKNSWTRPLPGAPLQKQLAADGHWVPPPPAALSGLILKVVQQMGPQRREAQDGAPRTLFQEGAPQGPPDKGNVVLWEERRPRCDGITALGGYVVEDTPKGDPLLQLPRSLFLSTADAPPHIKEKCLLQQHSSRKQQQQHQLQQLQPCNPEELLAVLLIKELLLLRQLRMKDPKAAKEVERGCMLQTNKRNAPYFGPFLRQALSLVMPQQGEQQLLQQLLQLARGPLAADLAAATMEDVKRALSLVHARSVWDGEGHVAVSALDELQEYHWSADVATQHETSSEGLLWRAHRDTRRGEKLYVNYGQYNNAYLLFHFGVEAQDNPWGPAFFWRAEVGDIAHAALPSGVATVSILRSAVSSSSALPLWLQQTAWAPKEAPCHPPLGGPPCTNPELNIEEPYADRVVAAPARSAKGEQGIACDQRVFIRRAFGRGVFVLSRFGAVGGVDPTVYKCVRVMRFGGIADELELETLTSGHFYEACENHQAQLTQAEYVLQGGLAATENHLLMLQRSSSSGAAEDAQEEIERIKAMQRAVQSNKELTERCTEYFKATLDSLRQKKLADKARRPERAAAGTQKQP